MNRHGTSAAEPTADRGSGIRRHVGNGPLVFINHRTRDQPIVATFLYLELARRYGSQAVFINHESVLPGTPFDRALLTAARTCSVMLSVIGPGWLAATDDNGVRMLDKRGDWVRKEIAAALDAGVTVVPVLLGSTPRLRAIDLPRSIRGLAKCHNVRIRQTDVAHDIARLARQLEAIEPRLTGSAA